MAMSNEKMLTMARALPLPDPWNWEIFIANIARVRGRKITLTPVAPAALQGSPCGLWLAREHDDLLLHEAGTSEYHTDQILGHAIGHRVLGHGPDPATNTDTTPDHDLLRQVLPDIDAETVLAVLGHNNYDSNEERDAEMFASLLSFVITEATERQSMMRNAFFSNQ